MLSRPTDDIYCPSPSSHLVPSSPFIAHRSGSPAPSVPDIDRLDKRKVLRRAELFGSNTCPSPHYSASQSSQTDSQLQRIPFTPNMNDCYGAEKKHPPQLDSQALEQVVPCCSPFIPADEKCPSKADSQIDEEEKPSLAVNKRKNRMLAISCSSQAKQLDLFKKDNIFDSN